MHFAEFQASLKLLSPRGREFSLIIIVACFGPCVLWGFGFRAFFLTCKFTFCALGLGYLQVDWAVKLRSALVIICTTKLKGEAMSIRIYYLIKKLMYSYTEILIC